MQGYPRPEEDQGNFRMTKPMDEIEFEYSTYHLQAMRAEPLGYGTKCSPATSEKIGPCRTTCKD